MKGGPSPHLDWDELACHDGTEYPAAWRLNRAIELARAFEAIRRGWDLPIQVLSAYRTEAYNKQIGGAPHSMHVVGLALDLRPPEGVPVRDFWKYICQLQATAGIWGIGYAASQYGNYVHVDIRPKPPSGVPIHWRYPLTAQPLKVVP